MTPEARTYFVANVPGWIVAAIAAWAAVRWLEARWWLAAGLAALWVVKDLVLYPWMRQYYRYEPADQRMVGQRGVTLSTLHPTGLVRVRGEIWQARLGEPGDALRDGATVRVREVHGLLVIVEPERPSD